MSHDRKTGDVDDQSDLVAFLSRPDAYAGRPERVERIESLISFVFLAGDRAYKLKRAVRLPYLDFSTVERRRAACEEEMRVNRRTAPALYLDLLPVVRAADGALAIGGAGTPVDWLIVMARFPQDCLLDAVATRDGLVGDLPRKLADAVARFHGSAPVVTDLGGPQAMSALVELNTRRLAETGLARRDPALAARLDRETRHRLEHLRDELEARRRDGMVRHVHGDLHLRNVVLLDGVPTLFDAIEFSREIACCDVLYDLAFLLMDIVHRGFDAAANAVMNRYLDVTGDPGVRLLPVFMSIRAAIRAHVSAGAASLRGEADTPSEAAEPAEYLALAAGLLRPAEPLVLAIGGLSGTGKSSVAAGLAPRIRPAPGARILRADVLRKRLAGVLPEQRLPDASYTPERTARVYSALIGQAAAAGHPVIVDATFADPARRDAIARAAASAGARFVGVWLEGDPSILKERVARRSGDASDATPAVVERQAAADVGAITWARIDATAPLAEVVERVGAAAGLGGPRDLPNHGDSPAV